MAVSHHDLNRFRLQADPAADEPVRAFFAAGRASEVYEVLRRKPEQLMHQTDELSVFLRSTRGQPAWLDAKKMRTAQALFKAHTAAIMGVLGAFSLPFCYAAAPGNKALYLSDKMRKAPGKRLMDTAQFVQEVCQPATPEAFIFAINRTRLIHAIARWHLHSHGWNMQWGEPINQEDMAGTNLAFSYLVLLGLQQSGILLTPFEKESFLHLWRYIGFQLHIDEALLPDSFAAARTLTTHIRARNLQHSPEGAALAQELILFYQSLTGAKDVRAIEAQLAWYLGREVSGYLGIRISPNIYRFVDLVQQTNVLARLLGRALPGLDQFSKLKSAMPKNQAA